MTPETAVQVKPLLWSDGCLLVLDQRLLPQQEVWIECSQVQQVVVAIRDMQVRGAPAIGIAAAYGVALAARQRFAEVGADWKTTLEKDLAALAASRPTAVNLFWALKQMRRLVEGLPTATDPFAELLAGATAIHQADLEANLLMGKLGAAVIAADQERGREVMTHCNAGALATAGYGTALGVIRSAWEQGLIDKVHVNETRPWWQGSRLTAWELVQEGIPAQLNVDSAAAHQLKLAPISWVVVGADRITANGDVANKIGTYQLAIQALHHGAGLMVVAPTSTIDMELESGDLIEIEDRGAEEVVYAAGQRIAAEIDVVNPVFDVTPADLVDVLITEKGVIHRPNREQLEKLMSRKAMH
ncbi:S-methyl-5-thioribose-1-phosphate isomerase [Marinospirillum alkaliphilum]|uniref:Methylthioribose-1-phosphate isomerase n=1 Tax=Marinospirillum alkaliphilum DSM 21637 TaxID=1122209 RepID=A0A1K2A0A2_9GAMM|nr:S-methyl-5-thioribose-1-phosphate isomerase [Marinospirillum alkaliphilum]SFX79459.1 methylthioribose-1-phosphate isomerase [Marinospirillum alkaliphilum DSM 21637]